MARLGRFLTSPRTSCRPLLALGEGKPKIVLERAFTEALGRV